MKSRLTTFDMSYLVSGMWIKVALSVKSNCHKLLVTTHKHYFVKLNMKTNSGWLSVRLKF